MKIVISVPDGRFRRAFTEWWEAEGEGSFLDSLDDDEELCEYSYSSSMGEDDEETSILITVDEDD